MGSNIKDKALTSLIWRFLECSGAQGVSLVVSIVLARLLAPEVYGTVNAGDSVYGNSSGVYG